MMTTRKRGGTRDYKINREARGKEEYDVKEYDYTTYYGEEIFLRSSLFESEKLQLESRISNLESKNRSVECKIRALVVSITVLLIATMVIMTMSMITFFQATTSESISLEAEDWKVC